jgi:hypothetical protein
MVTNKPIKTPFNEAQISILRLLDRKISEQELYEIKDLLVNYFDQKLKKQIELDIAQNNIGSDQFDALRKGVKPTKIIAKRNASHH